MKEGVTVQGAGQAQRTAEARLSSEERKTSWKWYWKFENAVLSFPHVPLT